MTQNLPAFLQNRKTPALAQNLSGHLGVGAPPYLSIAGNRFTLIDATGAEEPVETYDPKTGPYLDCVIIDALDRISKIYYNKPYDPGSAQFEPPACFSDNGITASRNASTPQNAPSFRCDTCPNSAWGSKVSAVSGKGVKACSDYQKLALMIPGDEVVFLLRIPPNSLSNLRNYVNKFTGQQIDMSDVITRVSFEPQGIGTLKFDAINYIDETSFGRREKLLAARATDALIGRTDQPRDPALAGPSLAPQITAPPAAPSTASPALPQSPLPSAAPPPQAQIMPSPVGGVPTASPSEPPRQRRRRNTAQQPAQAAPAPQAAPMQPFQPQSGPAPAVNGQQGGFGVQESAPVPNELENTLNSLFGPAG